jgi:biotin synthase
VACNRPFGNEKPGNDLRNYPFALEAEDIALVRRQLTQY